MKFLKLTGIALFLVALATLISLPLLSRLSLTPDKITALSALVGTDKQEAATKALNAFKGDHPKIPALMGLEQQLKKAKWDSYSSDDFLFQVSREAGAGFFWENKTLVAWLILLGAIGGGLLFILPDFILTKPGIHHNGMYQNPATNAGWVGILAAVFLISFYILLYFNHFLITEWIAIADPFSMALRGELASQWFMYGFLYTLAIVVMGVRMIMKYRHSNYHLIRTGSIIFFQICFAFLLPQIFYVLHLPEDDLKNIWPLNYYFFFDWNIAKHIDSGTFGVFMLVWGITLAAVGVPLLTYFFGKRWYCSWVCGCGGLAETLGDPYRQLSDKSTEAWQIERVLIHGVLAFAVVMTGLTLYTYFTHNSLKWTINPYIFVGVIWAAAVSLFAYYRYRNPAQNGYKVLATLASIAGLITIWVFADIFPMEKASLRFTSYDIRTLYGFGVGSIFAGVVGTGFYPVMGNRVWCRFGCPLAAYLGIIQRFKSRFRITTNGGQCISCGNCSTYCEMGIDVRAYAQKGENIVRSSCVGCGVCAAVCPRGVLALEVGPEVGRI